LAHIKGHGPAPGTPEGNAADLKAAAPGQADLDGPPTPEISHLQLILIHFVVVAHRVFLRANDGSTVFAQNADIFDGGTLQRHSVGIRGIWDHIGTPEHIVKGLILLPDGTAVDDHSGVGGQADSPGNPIILSVKDNGGGFILFPLPQAGQNRIVIGTARKAILRYIYSFFQNTAPNYNRLE